MQDIDYKNFVGFHPFLADKPEDTSILLDSKGRFRTRSLFLEPWKEYTKAKRSDLDMGPLYSLKDRNDQGLPSAYLIYITSADEYEAAMKLVGSIAHWDELTKCKWFTESSKLTRGLDQWRIDMARRNASLGMRTLIQLAKGGDGAAARKLLDISGSDFIKRGPGRPSPKKEEEAKERERVEREKESQLERLYKSVTSNEPV